MRKLGYHMSNKTIRVYRYGWGTQTDMQAVVMMTLIQPEEWDDFSKFLESSGFTPRTFVKYFLGVAAGRQRDDVRSAIQSRYNYWTEIKRYRFNVSQAVFRRMWHMAYDMDKDVFKRKTHHKAFNRITVKVLGENLSGCDTWDCIKNGIIQSAGKIQIMMDKYQETCEEKLFWKAKEKIDEM